ncbi:MULTISPECIES: hypothetical protein [unclassified Bradyrhizobium]|uniref:hypothetical protein n=1 Tax=unclassified Bradyrhizobium TaxID=2631580 RepID=UPI0003FBE5E7|nr:MULTISPECIES: hypothetical protein [unclassified Bradyrhizobium]MCP3462971.1 hypothetical protein [Bradyrhizobium sp. CCGUVB23]
MHKIHVKSFVMKRAAILCTASLFALQAGAAAAKSITCSYPQDQELTFEVPKKQGGLPPIDFDYPSKVTLFSFRDDNLLVVAMDESDKSRVRVVISAQRDKAKGIYAGQIVTDLGGNQLMLDNGPVTCKVKG